MANESPETMPLEAVDLMGQIMSANARDAAFTSNRLLEMMERDRDRMATALVTLYEAVDRAAEVVTTRDLEKALDRATGPVHEAYAVLGGPK